MGVLDIFDVRSDFHAEHCQRTAFLVYAGVGALIASIFIFFFFNAQFGANLIMLFGIALLSGFAAVFWYNYEHEKWPFRG